MAYDKSKAENKFENGPYKLSVTMWDKDKGLLKYQVMLDYKPVTGGLVLSLGAAVKHFRRYCSSHPVYS